MFDSFSYITLRKKSFQKAILLKEKLKENLPFILEELIGQIEKIDPDSLAFKAFQQFISYQSDYDGETEEILFFKEAELKFLNKISARSISEIDIGDIHQTYWKYTFSQSNIFFPDFWFNEAFRFSSGCGISQGLGTILTNQHAFFKSYFSGQADYGREFKYISELTGHATWKELDAPINPVLPAEAAEYLQSLPENTDDENTNRELQMFRTALTAAKNETAYLLFLYLPDY